MLGLWCRVLLLAKVMALPVHNTIAGCCLPAKRWFGWRIEVRLSLRLER